MARRGSFGRLAGGAATALAMAALSGGPAPGEPRGGVVAAGAASIETRGGTTTIRQGGRRVVIDWESFDIDADEAVRFVQPSRDAVALNRVLDGLPTHIRGRLLANGNVWLVNPSGVYFHAGSVVDVGGLIATTADIDDDRFMAGGGRFDEPGDPDARIVNEGRITFAEAGLAGFVAPHVENRGVIEGKLGRIVMAGREGFSVEVSGDGLFEIDVEDAAPGLSSRVENLGRLAAEGGTVVLTASAVRDAVAAAVHAGGVIEATRARRSDDGAIVLDAGEGRLEIAGELSTRGSGRAAGGRIDATGRAVEVAAGARIDVSGEAGGGRVRLGGDAGGPGDLVPAETVAVAAGARVAADGLDAGSGGEVLVWSERASVVAGTLSVRGGPAGGDGGFVEISSAGGVGFSGRVALEAPLGRPGGVLFDPFDLVISAGSGVPVGGDVAAGDPPATLTILAASLETIGGAVTLEAVNDVIVEAGVSVTNPDPAASLTLRAGNDVILGGGLDFGRDLTLVADGIAPDGLGAIRIAGEARLVAGGVLGLSAPGGIDGAGMGAGATLTLGSRADLTLPETTLAGALDIRVQGNAELTLGGDLAAGSARLAATGGIFGAGAVATAGDLTLDASKVDPVDSQTSFQDVRLSGALSVGGRLSAVGDTVALRSAGDLRFEDGFARTALEIEAGGALTAARITSGDAFGSIATGRILLAAGGDVAVSDLRAGALTVGGPGSTQASATSLPGDLRLDRAIVAGPMRLRADGAAALEDVSAGAGVLAVGGDVLIRRALHDGTLSLTAGGAATLDGLRADGLTATAASLALAQVATGTLRATATTGSLIVAPEVASGDLADGFTIVAAPPELPRTFAGDAPLVPPTVAGGAIGALLAVTGDAVLAAAGDVTLTPGAVEGVEKAILLPRLEAQAGGVISGRIAGDLELGPVEAAGVDLSNDGALTQTGLLSAGGDVRLSGADAVTLGPITAGTLSVESGGPVGQTAALSVAGATRVSSPDAVSLTRDNLFGGPVALSAGSAEIAAAGPLHLDDVQVAGDLVAVSGPGAVAATLDGVSFETALRLERASIGGAALLAAPGGVALSNLEAGSVTVGGIGSVAGAPTPAPGDVAVHRGVLGALTIAADGAAGGIGGVRISDVVLAGDLRLSGAPRVALSGVTLGRDAAFEPGAAPNGLSLERVATRGDLALDVAGDVSLALVDVRAGLATPGGLSIRTPGDVLKRPDAATDFAADGRFTLDLGAAGARAVVAPGPSGDLLGVAGATAIAAGGAILLPTAEDGAGGRRLRLAGPLSFEARGDAVLSAAGPLTIAAGAVGGDAAVGAAGPGAELSQSGALSVAGALTLAVEGDAALGRADNAFASVSGEVAGRLTLRDADGFAVSDARLGGLSIAGQGGATPLRDVAATGEVSVSGDAVSAERVAAGGALTLVSGGGLAVSDLASGGIATLRADGDLSAVRFDFGALTAEATGALALSDGAAGGSSTLDAGAGAALSGVRFADATLSATEAALSGVSAASLAATARAGDATLAGVEVGGALTVRAAGDVRGAAAPGEIAAVTVAGARAARVGVETGARLGDPAGGLTADLPAEGGRVLAAEALAHLASAGGAARIEAGGAVALGVEPGGARVSRFGGPLSLEAGGDGAVHAAGAVTLGPSAIGGDFALRSDADGAAPGGTAGIGQVGDVSVGGRAGFETGAPGAPAADRADVTLDRPGNRFTTVAVTARDLTLRDADGFALVDTSLTGASSIGAGAPQAGDVTLRDVTGVDASVAVAGALQATTVRLTGRSSLVAGAGAILTDLALGEATLVAGGPATLTRIAATTLAAEAASLEVRDAAVGRATLSAGADAAVTGLTGDAAEIAARDVSATDLTVRALAAAARRDLTAERLDGASAALTAGRDMTLDDLRVTATTASAGAALRLSELSGDEVEAAAGGPATLSRLAATGAVSVAAGGAATLTDLGAGGLDARSEGALSLTRVSSGSTTLAAGTAAMLEDVTTGTTDLAAGAASLTRMRAGDLTARIAGDLTASDLAVRSLTAEAGGDARGERVTAAGAAALTVGGAVETRDLIAGGPLSLSAGTQLTALRTVVDGDAALSSGDGTILQRAKIGGTLAATADLDGSAGAEALRLREVRTGALTAETGGTQDLDAVAVADATSLLARDGAIRLGTVETGGTLKAVALSGAILTQPGSARAAAFVAAGAAPAAPPGAPAHAPRAGGGPAVAAPAVAAAAPDRTVAERRFGGLLVTGGDAWLDASGAVLLPHDGLGGLENDFRGAVTVSRAARLALADAGDLEIGAPATRLPGVGAVAASGIDSRVAGERVAAASLSVGRDLSDTAEARIRVRGDLDLEAGRRVRLVSGRHDAAAVALRAGGGVRLHVADDLILGPTRLAAALHALANARDAAPAARIGQIRVTTTPRLAMAATGAVDAAETRRGALRIDGDADFATGAPGARDIADLGPRGDLSLGDGRNVLSGEVSIRRIFGDVLLVEEAASGRLAEDAIDGGALRIANLEAGGDMTLVTSDDVILLGPRTALSDAEAPRTRVRPPAPMGPEAFRRQGVKDLARDDLHLFLPDGRLFEVDTTAAGLDRAGGDLRVDRPIDGLNALTTERTVESVSVRDGAGAMRIVAGRRGDVRLRDFVGAGRPIGRFRVVSADDVSLGHTYAARDPSPDDPRLRFLLGLGPREDVDLLAASDIEIDARGAVVIHTPRGLLAEYEGVDDYYGLNTPALVFGQRIEPAELELFGFIGDSGQRAAGLFPVGPRGPEFRLNGCVIGDVQDCTGVTAPTVLRLIRLDQAQILNVEEEDLLELFVSYGNEELWGVPPGYFLDIDLSEVRALGNAQGRDEEDGRDPLAFPSEREVLR